MTSLKALESLSSENLLEATYALIISMKQRHNLELGTSFSELISDIIFDRVSIAKHSYSQPFRMKSTPHFVRRRNRHVPTAAKL
jgi:hypothetical protein